VIKTDNSTWFSDLCLQVKVNSKPVQTPPMKFWLKYNHFFPHRLTIVSRVKFSPDWQLQQETGKSEYTLETAGTNSYGYYLYKHGLEMG